MSSEIQNASPNSEENEPFNMFTCFPRLPTELKLEVWRFSIPQSPHVIRLRIHENTKEEQAATGISIRITSTNKPEPLLSLSRLSRDAVLKEYASIRQPYTDAIIRFNQYVDTIYLVQLHPDVRHGDHTQYSHPVIPRTKSQNIPRDIDMDVSDMFDNIQNLAVDSSWIYSMVEEEDRISKGLFLAHFRNLKRLIWIVHTHHDTHSPQYGAPQEVAHGPWEIELQDPEDHAQSLTQSRYRAEMYLNITNIVRRKSLVYFRENSWMVDIGYKKLSWEKDVVIEVKGVKPDPRRSHLDKTGSIWAETDDDYKPEPGRVPLFFPRTTQT